MASHDKRYLWLLRSFTTICVVSAIALAILLIASYRHNQNIKNIVRTTVVRLCEGDHLKFKKLVPNQDCQAFADRIVNEEIR